MTTRQTLRDFLTSTRSTATGISYAIEAGPDGLVDQGDDLGIEPNTGRPLIDTASGEALLGDYLSFITQKNDYPIAPGAHESVSPDRGSALSKAETSSAVEVFADSRIGTNAESLNRSNSMIFDSSGVPLATIIDKIGDGSAASGNELLPSTVAAAASSDVALNQTAAVKGAFASFKKYNYYSPTSSPSNFAKDDDGNSLTPSNFEQTRKERYQVEKGVYSVDETDTVAEITQFDLANIARSMILKSAGWDDSTRPADAKNPNDAFSTVSEATLTRFPEIIRDNLGVVDAFRAQDSYGFPSNPDGSSKLSGRGDVVTKVYDEAKYTRTRGGTHTPDQPFGENPFSDNRIQSLQAGLSMIGLAALIDKKLINMTQIVKDLQVTEDTVLRGPYYLGRSTRSDLDAKTRALVRTFMSETGIYSYEKCVAEGLYACFGYKSQGNTNQITDDLSTSTIASTYGDVVKKIAKDLGSEFFDSPMGLSQGFWRATTESTLEIIRAIRRSTQKNDGVDYVRCLLSMKDSLAVKVMNVFASLGFQRLVIQGISTVELEEGEQPINPYGIDDYPNAPGTRQMKSRDGSLLNKSSLAWRHSALPSAFILPLEAMAAALDADYMFNTEKGSNPIKGMLGSTLYDKTYVKGSRNSGAIPAEVAKNLEDRLGAEYVPFYIRDLRTNEIIAFHAFLDSLSDGFSANYSDTKGFGRSDTVKNYAGTSRSINLGFHIVSTSKEDFDEMWYKINKLTTLVYPQYTRGRNVFARDKSSLTAELLSLNRHAQFEQPFSQLVGGTPVVRLRVGDLIKTNYTRSNLGRLFGVGNDTFGAKIVQPIKPNGIVDSNRLRELAQEGSELYTKYGKNLENFDLRFSLFLALTGSPMEATKLKPLLDKISIPIVSPVLSIAADALTNVGSDLLVNGFVNPWLYDNRSNNQDLSLIKYRAGTRHILKPRSTPYLVTINNRQRYMRLLRPIFVKLIDKIEQRTGDAYEAVINDETVGVGLNGGSCRISAADLYIDASGVVDIASFPGILLILGAVSTLDGLVNNGLTGAFNLPIDIRLEEIFSSLGRSFIEPAYNPITRAFEDRMGEGLAGVIKSLSFKWLEADWETDWNSRAPMTCHVTIQFDPIHDISPGIDSNGYNRAPVYNVGQIMNDAFGNSREDGGAASRFFYKQGGVTAETATQPSLQQKK